MQPVSLLKTPLFILFAIAISQSALAQSYKPRNDSIGNSNPGSVMLKNNNKLIKENKPDSVHKPGVAFKRSAFVPGWGQIYNRRWWKVPLIYGGLGALGYNFVVNQKDYKSFFAMTQFSREANPNYAVTQKNNPDYIRYVDLRNRGVNTAQFESATSNAQRNVQVTALSFILVWGVQIIDAYIDAKFIHSYTMDNNLSIKLSPGVNTLGTMYAANSNQPLMPVMRLSLTL